MGDRNTIFVTYDGDTYWLECFADDPGASRGAPVHPIDTGDEWPDLAAKVAAHQTEHGCGTDA